MINRDEKWKRDTDGCHERETTHFTVLTFSTSRVYALPASHDRTPYLRASLRRLALAVPSLALYGCRNYLPRTTVPMEEGIPIFLYDNQII